MLKKIVTGMLGLAIGLGLAAPAHAETTPAAAGTPGDPFRHRLADRRRRDRATGARLDPRGRGGGRAER